VEVELEVLQAPSSKLQMRIPAATATRTRVTQISMICSGTHGELYRCPKVGNN
jgi:hypothetical protein